MFGDLLHHLGRLAYALLERYSRDAWYSAPRPPDPRAVVRGPGHDPDRVLLIGEGVAIGWGVVSHELGVAGHLARGNSAVTRRGTDLDVVAYPGLGIPEIMAELTPRRIAHYDAIVLTIGIRETLELMPRRRWKQQVTALLDHLSTDRAANPCVIVVGVPEEFPESVNAAVRNMAAARAATTNSITRSVLAGRPRMSFAGGAPVSSAEDFDADATYERAARGIIPLLADALDHSPDRVRVPVDEEARLAAVEWVESAEVRDDPRIHLLLATAKEVLQAHSVDFFFVGRDEVRLLAATTETGLAAPREGSLSNEVLEHPRGFVIPDLAADPRNRDRPQVTGEPYLRFYAGHPVESPDGHRIGVLAVVDTQPRTFSAAELSLLRNFALRAGMLLFDR
ncbi:GAF domain-containing protein [Schumannella luteola]